MTIRSYRDLRVWNEAMAVAEGCYRLTKGFPKDELFGMTSQIRRSAVGVAANIAEGYGRESTGAYIQFLRIAQGSLKELETHLLLAERIGLTKAETAKGLLDSCESVGKMLRSLMRSVERSPKEK